MYHQDPFSKIALLCGSGCLLHCLSFVNTSFIVPLQVSFKAVMLIWFVDKNRPILYTCVGVHHCKAGSVPGSKLLGNIIPLGRDCTAEFPLRWLCCLLIPTADFTRGHFPVIATITPRIQILICFKMRRDDDEIKQSGAMGGSLEKTQLNERRNEHLLSFNFLYWYRSTELHSCLIPTYSYTRLPAPQEVHNPQHALNLYYEIPREARGEQSDRPYLPQQPLSL